MTTVCLRRTRFMHSYPKLSSLKHVLLRSLARGHRHLKQANTPKSYYKFLSLSTSTLFFLSKTTFRPGLPWSSSGRNEENEISLTYMYHYSLANWCVSWGRWRKPNGGPRHCRRPPARQEECHGGRQGETLVQSEGEGGAFDPEHGVHSEPGQRMGLRPLVA